MIIGVTGFGASGASACLALIKEFEDVQYYPNNFEFQLLQQPDGICDLKYHIVYSRRRININSAIARFIKQMNFHRSNGEYQYLSNNAYKKLSTDYVSKIINLTWKGKSVYDPEDYYGNLERGIGRLFGALINRLSIITKSDLKWPPAQKRYYSFISEEDFNEFTHKYLYDLFVASGFDVNRPILLEQLFCLEHPIEGSEFLSNDFRSIIVDRDPRDVFLLTNGYSAKTCSFMPNTGDVTSFIEYYKGLHHNKCSNKKVKYIKFEDLIYDYDKTVLEMQDFLGLKHLHPKRYFRPEWSINNTQIYKKYPQYSDKIKTIETCLEDYLYPFDSKEKNLTFEPEKMKMFDEKPGDQEKSIKKNRF